MEKIMTIKRGTKVECTYCNTLYSSRSSGQRYCSPDCAARSRYLHTFGERVELSVKTKYVNKAYQKLFDARARGLAYNLTAAFIERTLEGACHYCGVKACVLERYDNTIGYLETNVVPSCVACNNLKRTMHGDDYMRYRRFMEEGTMYCVAISEIDIVDTATGIVYQRKTL